MEPLIQRGIFIDLQNLYSAGKSSGYQLDYQSFRNYFLQSPAHYTRFTAFSSYDPQREDQHRFLMALARMGYRIVSKPLKRLPSGETKANMDMEMAMEILAVAPHLHEIVIVSGDGDFTALVNYLIQQGKIVKVAGPDEYTASELIQACHEFIPLSTIPGFLRKADK